MASLKQHSFQILYGPADAPLNNFYIPALKSCIQYDRSAGFFSSTALAVAAEGVAHLIQNGGKMRLLVGAALSEDDVEAIRSGHDLREKVNEALILHFPDPQNALEHKRLEVMAWMVAQGTLEIKVVLPRDKNALPIPASQCSDYYHPKTGIMTDAEGNQVAFSGSVNESATAWVKNYELFTVYFSWNETRPYLAQISINFEKLWAGKEPDWIAIDIPEAVRQRLLRYKPDQAPVKDPLEKEEQPAPGEPARQSVIVKEQRERILFQFLRDAPHLVGSNSLGAATCAVTPWPHQTRVAESLIQRFPERAMLCDEVGLGKTIEAGLIIRQLVLSGFVKRCLILAPKSVLRQWQEEMFEKFALRIPLFDGARFWDLYGKPLPTPDGNPWQAYPIMLAGSQLAKRADRREQILASGGWDLLVVDEAHHARRKDFKERIYRPNRLLALVNELTQQNKVTGLLLMTATPMQVHPVEVWDLLKLLGLGARWGSDEDNFLHYFSELQKPFGQVDWDFILDMLRDELQAGGTLDENFVQQVRSEIGPVKWAALEELPFQQAPRIALIRALGAQVKPHIKEMARRHTPLRRYLFRNTRNLLREYQRQGILLASVPKRRPSIIRVLMREEEFALYEKIQEYISYFYQKYENERRGMGFIMTVYRRRLTSSFYAVRCSLERRLKYLRGEVKLDTIVDDDDLEQDELSYDSSDELSADHHEKFKAEISYLQRFIQDLRVLAVADSKLESLKEELSRVFRQRSTVLVFTQYTDTMDYLRTQLVDVYGSSVACYSGRGGEVWNGIAWVQTTKEFVKNEFKADRIRILLCTESASEGLNLQTCGVLINYDMPWNPMRVEQRIGRIDRIGQHYPVVWISNYFYQNTIEDIIYQRLAERINWFEVVVGELQPILAEVGEVMRRLAMLSTDQREIQLENEINALKQRLQNREVESLNLDNFIQAEDYQQPQPSPINLIQLEKMLTTSNKTSVLFTPHPTIDKAYLLKYKDGEIPVTFTPVCFDEHPGTLELITYGNPILNDLLNLMPSPNLDHEGRFIRISSTGEPELHNWYTQGADAGQLESISCLDDLVALLDKPSELPGDEGWRENAHTAFQNAVKGVVEHQKEVIERRRYGIFLAEKTRAQRLLVKAVLIELALGQQPGLLEKEQYPSAFNEQAILSLRRHGYPWGALIHLAFEPGLTPHPEDDFYQQIKDSTSESLKSKFAPLIGEAKKSVQALNAAKKAVDEV